MSEVEDIRDILTLEFIEAVENQKTVKNRNKNYLMMIDFEFSKRIRLCKISLSQLLELIKANVVWILNHMFSTNQHSAFQTNFTNLEFSN